MFTFLFHEMIINLSSFLWSVQDLTFQMTFINLKASTNPQTPIFTGCFYWDSTVDDSTKELIVVCHELLEKSLLFTTL